MRHVVHDVSAWITWLCWATFAVVWIVGGVRRSRTPACQHDGGPRDWLSLRATAAGVLVVAAPGELWRPLQLHVTAAEVVGVIVLVPSTVAAIWARVVLGSGWSSAPQVPREDALRTHGPYAITRHPIYSAVATMLIGTALTQDLGRSAVLALAVTLVLRSKIAEEERLLERAFPEQYAGYRQRVPKLVPRLHRARR